ncbi:hypothetical protein ACI5KX_11100 [Erythrobacter sp. GH1-10]|uniref:hypothetical protein n=1 Tax=Erythrobacter sp. GH1-10 TaxID=3349334 RepID=UPI003877D3C8
MLIDVPPPPSPDAPITEIVEPHLPTEERADGSLVIDLTPLAPTPTECAKEEPDPFNPEIVVCRESVTSPRLGADYGPTAEEVIEGSAIPRARLKLSDNAELQANTVNKGVGGFNANGGEVRLKIDF